MSEVNVDADINENLKVMQEKANINQSKYKLTLKESGKSGRNKIKKNKLIKTLS
jgi:hypothetical protein